MRLEIHAVDPFSMPIKPSTVSGSELTFQNFQPSHEKFSWQIQSLWGNDLSPVTASHALSFGVMLVCATHAGAAA